MKDLFYITPVKYDGKDKFIEQVVKKYNQSPNFKPVSWQENVHSSITYDQCKSIEEYSIKSNIPKSLVGDLNNHVQSFVKQKNIDEVGRFYISEIWYNAYKNRQYQHMHKHSNSYNNVFSGVYYVKYNNQEHTSTRFYHPGFEIDFEKVRTNPFFVYTPDVKENDLIIFPSDIGHDVPIQDTNDLRITVSFNVKCDYYDQLSYS